MNKTKLVKELHKLGGYCEKNEGTKHDKFRNKSKPGKIIEVPRNCEINEYLAKAILKDARR